MASGKLFSFQYFPSFSNSELFYEKMMESEGAGVRIFNQVVLLGAFLFVYGLVMGAYHSPLQAVVSGVKLAVLFTLALLICFPAFFIVQYILGSRLRLHQMISILLSGFVLMAAIMLSFIPIVVIFLLTGGNYYFLHLLHIAIMIFAGIFGMNTIVKALEFSCEKKDVYPRTGVVVFRFWVVILAFVGIQLAWNFRPFLGEKDKPFEMFTHKEGNFYAAVIYAVDQLLNPDKPVPENAPSRRTSAPPPDNTVTDIFRDTAGGK